MIYAVVCVGVCLSVCVCLCVYVCVKSPLQGSSENFSACFSGEADNGTQSQEFLDNLPPIISLGFVCVQNPKFLDSIQRKQ